MTSIGISKPAEEDIIALLGYWIEIGEERKAIRRADAIDKAIYDDIPEKPKAYPLSIAINDGSTRLCVIDEYNIRVLFEYSDARNHVDIISGIGSRPEDSPSRSGTLRKPQVRLRGFSQARRYHLRARDTCRASRGNSPIP